MTATSVPTMAAPSGSPPVSAVPWRKRPWVLAVVGVAIAVAAMVITDLPPHSTKATNVASVQGVIKEVAGDAAPCSYGVHEALGLYADVRASTLSAADRSEVPTLVGDDYAACSFTNQDIDDLAGIEEPNSPVGRGLNGLVTETLSWCNVDAMVAIGYISELVQRPGDAAAAAGLVKSERRLDAERLHVDKSITVLGQLLGTSSLARVNLVKV